MSRGQPGSVACAATRAEATVQSRAARAARDAECMSGHSAGWKAAARARHSLASIGSYGAGYPAQWSRCRARHSARTDLPTGGAPTYALAEHSKEYHALDP